MEQTIDDVENDALGWSSLPLAARRYVVVCIGCGAVACALLVPFTLPRPGLLAALVVAACLTSIWKVNLPIAMTSGSTLSVSYAADLMSLVLLGPGPALVVAMSGVLAQCTINVKRRYPWYRTIFSMSAEAITIVASGFVYVALGGPVGSLDPAALPAPLVGAIATYFFVNTGLVACAIALSTRQRCLQLWRSDFAWSGVSFIVAGTAGAVAAVVVDRGQTWTSLLMLAPVYLTYQTYRVFVGRLEDERRHVAELEAARHSAEQANQLKDQFLAVVSHELRTPLNAILGWAEMLRTGVLENGRRDRATQAIYDSARRQAHLIDELLDVARIMSGKLTLERARVDLREIVRTAIEVVQPAADAKRIRMHIDADPSVGEFFGDGPRLQQIAWNLLTNAVKFTPHDGSLSIGLHRRKDVMELSVTDTGQGIPQELLSSVFEPFRQADGSTTRRHGGLGLGLSIVRHLVEAHGGTIGATSSGEGRGSIFTVRLPIARVRSGRAPADTAHQPIEPLPPSTALSGVRVLVVDDDDESREVVAAFLEAHHAEVIAAASAAQAVSILQRRPVDVLVADIAMPGEDGYQLIRRIRGMDAPHIASIPAAALTAFARDGDRQQALGAGFQRHLTKPIDARALVEAVAGLAAPAQAAT